MVLVLPYPEKVTAEQLEYENINPLYATYEAGKSMAADLASLGSAAGGYATDQTLGRFIDQDIKTIYRKNGRIKLST